MLFCRVRDNMACCPGADRAAAGRRALQHRRADGLGDIGGVCAAAAVGGLGGKPDLVVDDHMQGASCRVPCAGTAQKSWCKSCPQCVTLETAVHTWRTAKGELSGGALGQNPCVQHEQGVTVLLMLLHTLSRWLPSGAIRCKNMSWQRAWKVSQLQRLSHDAQAGQGSVAMDEQPGDARAPG